MHVICVCDGMCYVYDIVVWNSSVCGGDVIR